MKVNPITQRAKSSPYKANSILIAGAGEVGKKFMDYGQALGVGIERGEGKRKPMPQADGPQDEEPTPPPPSEDPGVSEDSTAEDDDLINATTETEI